MKNHIALILAVLTAFFALSCENPTETNPDDNKSITAGFTGLDQDGNATLTTSKLVLTFDSDVSGLTIADVQLDPGSTGAVKDVLTAFDAGTAAANISRAASHTLKYHLSLKNIKSGGMVTVSLSKTGYIFTGSPKQVEIFYYVDPNNGINEPEPGEIPAELIAKWYMGQALADAGDRPATYAITEEGKLLTLGVDNNLFVRVDNNIISSYNGSEKAGTVIYSVSGTVLTLSGASSGSLLSNGTWYKKAEEPAIIPDIEVKFTGLQADGSATQMTTKLTLTFDKDIENLSVNDMVFDGKDTGAEANVLSKTGNGTYDLTLSGILSSGNVSVSVSKDGYDIANNEKEVSVYFFEATITDVYGDFEYSYGAVTRKVSITKYNGSGEEVVIPAMINNMPVTTIADGSYNSYNNEITGVFFNKNIATVTIPNSITHIGDYAFCNNQLTSVIIPNSVVTIGEYAFAGNQLDRVIIPNSVVLLGNHAFNYNLLTYVSISNKLTILAEDVFFNNILTSVVIPPNIVEIRHGAFGGRGYPDYHFDPWVHLKSITIGENVVFDKEAFHLFYSDGINGNIWPFFDCYNNNGKKAGTYISLDPDGHEWVRQN